MTGLRLPLGLGLAMLSVGTAPAAAQETVTYRYDAQGRLIVAEQRIPSGGSARNYVYDAAGNRVRVESYGQAVSSTVAAGSSLSPGQSIVSPDGRFRLVFRFDGNLVLYGPTLNMMWQSSTGGQGATSMGMQGDGNLAIYNSAGAFWTTSTAPNQGATLHLQSDGNLVIRSTSNAVLWATNTFG